MVDIDVALGRHFKEGDTEFIGKLLSLLSRNDTLLLPVTFVSDKDLVDTFRGVLLDVGEPGANI